MLTLRPAVLAMAGLATLISGLRAEDPPAPRTPKILILAVDGTRPDALELADTPNLDGLRASSAWSLDGLAGDVPISGPSYSSILTGVWRDKHGVAENDFVGSRFDLYPIFFCRMKTHDPSAVTQSIVRWAPLDPLLISCADHHVAPSTDALATTEAVRLLTETDPDALFFHLEDPDTAGHSCGFSAESACYLQAIEVADARVGAVLAALHARPRYGDEDWLVIALSDHGGSGKDHHANTPENRRVFWIQSGSRVVPGELVPGPRIVDVAVTAMVYLGLEIDPAWDLDGVPVALRADPLPSLQRPGDCDQDGTLSIGDPICLLDRLFLGEAADLPCGDGSLDDANRSLLDTNGDAEVDLSDAVHVLVHLFAGGSPPALGTACASLPGCPSICTGGV